MKVISSFKTLGLVLLIGFFTANVAAAGSPATYPYSLNFLTPNGQPSGMSPVSGIGSAVTVPDYSGQISTQSQLLGWIAPGLKFGIIPPGETIPLLSVDELGAENSLTLQPYLVPVDSAAFPTVCQDLVTYKFQDPLAKIDFVNGFVHTYSTRIPTESQLLPFKLALISVRIGADGVSVIRNYADSIKAQGSISCSSSDNSRITLDSLTQIFGSALQSGNQYLTQLPQLTTKLQAQKVADDLAAKKAADQANSLAAEKFQAQVNAAVAKALAGRNKFGLCFKGSKVITLLSNSAKCPKGYTKKK